MTFTLKSFRAALLYTLATSAIAFADTGDIQKPLTNIVIITSEQATPTEAFAAKELSLYLGKISGRDIPVINEKSRKGAAYRLLVGRMAASADHAKSLDSRKAGITLPADREAFAETYLIAAANDQTALIGGGDRGTLFSVYEFLEQQGCRYFSPAEEVIPRSDNIVLKPGARIFTPGFIQRELHISPSNPFGLKASLLWSVKNRLNRNAHIREDHVRKVLPESDSDILSVLQMQQWQANVHNFDIIMPTEKYYKDHPEYYALHKGVRVAQDDKDHITWKGGNLCLANEDVIRICSDFAIAWFDANPNGLVVPMWPMDGSIKWCECTSCTSNNSSDGAMTRNLLVFANEVARRVAKKYPDKFILMPSYHEYSTPVRDVVPEKNIVVQLCLHVDYARAIQKASSAESVQRLAEVMEWTRQAKNIGVWEYFLLGNEGGWSNGKWVAFTGDAKAHFPVLNRIRDMMPFLYTNGIRWYYTQANNKYWAYSELQYYLMARMLWDPLQDFSALMNDYLFKMYGKAAPYVKSFYTEIENAVERSDWKAGPYPYKEIVAVPAGVYTPEVLKKCADALSSAGQMDLSTDEKRRLGKLLETLAYLNANLTSPAETNKIPVQTIDIEKTIITGENIIRNGDFEDASKGWQMPAEGGTIDGVTFKSGKYAAKIAVMGMTPRAYYHQQLPSLKADTEYQLSYLVRIDALDLDPKPSTGGTGVFVNLFGHPGNRWFPANWYKKTTPWTREVFTFRTGAASDPKGCYFRVGLFNAAATIWFDDIRLIEITPANASQTNAR